MTLADNFGRVLARRGTRRLGDSEAGCGDLRARHEGFAESVLRMLAVQDGEDAALCVHAKYRFLSLLEIRASMDDIRDMVEVDETLPRAFLEFTPFLYTGLKTVVGEFKPRAGRKFLGVIEYDFESGKFARWSSCLDSFLHSLADESPPFDRLGT